MTQTTLLSVKMADNIANVAKSCLKKVSWVSKMLFEFKTHFPIMHLKINKLVKL